MSATTGKRGPTDAMPYVMLAGCVLIIVVVVGTWAAIAAGDLMAHQPAPAHNPFTADINLLIRKSRWPGLGATLVAATEALVVAALAVAIGRVIHRSRRTRLDIDAAAPYLSDRRNIAPLTAKPMAATARRLYVPATASPGYPVGLALPSRQRIYGSWEDLELDIWGPRTGKTTSRAVPVILAAPGCCLVTSNKRDVVDATRGIRDQVGRVWVFDPHEIVHEDPTWWWNPLSYVVDVDRAMRLAGLLSGFSRQADSKTDPFFDPEGEALLSFLLLAAAVGGRPITQVYRWAVDPTDAEPVDLLRGAGWDLPADGVQSVINSPDKQRGGVYSTAKKCVAFLVNPTVTRWITPRGVGDTRPQFDPHAYVRGHDTLYSMSLEGRSGGAMVAALNVACLEAGEELSTRSPGGRLSPPMVGMLDEAANGVRWRELPARYSHYGSKGIILLTILQSWAQGEDAWGEKGMEMLRDAANIRLYGGGSLDPKFLGNLSSMAGKFEPETYSTSSQRGGMASRSVSSQTRPEEIVDVADLAALPKGRALVLVSGTRPVLIETEPWTRGPHRAAIEASIRRYDPTGQLPVIDSTGEIVETHVGTG